MDAAGTWWMPTGPLGRFIGEMGQKRRGWPGHGTMSEEILKMASKSLKDQIAFQNRMERVEDGEEYLTKTLADYGGYAGCLLKTAGFNMPLNPFGFVQKVWEHSFIFFEVQNLMFPLKLETAGKSFIFHLKQTCHESGAISPPFTDTLRWSIGRAM